MSHVNLLNDPTDDLVLTLQSIDNAHRLTKDKTRTVSKTNNKGVVENLKEHVKFTQKTNTPFMHMAKCAVVIGVGDVLYGIGDIVWLAGDMLVQYHSHHLMVALIIVPALIIMGVSFIYLGRSLLKYEKKHKEHTDKLNENKIAKEIKEFYEHNREDL